MVFLRPADHIVRSFFVIACALTLALAPIAHAQLAARTPETGMAARSDEVRPDRAFAPAMEQSHERGVTVESDPVAMRAELAYNATMDVASAAAVQAARLEQARREAPFDLTWGFEE